MALRALAARREFACTHTTHTADIAAGAKSAPRADYDHAARRFVGAKRGKCVGKLVIHLGR